MYTNIFHLPHILKVSLSLTSLTDFFVLFIFAGA